MDSDVQVNGRCDGEWRLSQRSCTSERSSEGAGWMIKENDEIACGSSRAFSRVRWDSQSLLQKMRTATTPGTSEALNCTHRLPRYA